LKNLDASLRSLSILLRNINSEVKPWQRHQGHLACPQLLSGKDSGLERWEPRKILEDSRTLDQISSTLEQVQTTFSSYDKLAVDNAHIGYDVTRTRR
jgi:hypothetical protein